MWFCSSLVWTAALDSPFSVSPSSCDLAPLKSTAFRVTYDPKQLNTLHAAQLECFAYYKVMFTIYSKNSITSSEGASLLSKKICLWRHILVCLICHSLVLLLLMLQDNHHIEERLLCPPWCVTVRVIGHSFQPGKEHFTPCCSLKPPRVVRHAGERVQMLQYNFPLFCSIDLSPLVCPLSIILPFSQWTAKHLDAL